MKKYALLLLVVILTLSCLTGAAAAGSRMKVANCSDYVSLRSEPSTKSERLAKVYLGEYVEDCSPAGSKFIGCEYDGLYGYILAEYLVPVDEDVNDTFAALNDMPKHADLIKTGINELDVKINGYTVTVQSGVHNDYDALYAVCYDAKMKPLWQVMHVASVPMTELPAMKAFIGGTEDEPELVIFSAADSMLAYGIGKWTDILWEADTSNIGGCLQYAKDGEGRLYLTGYYDNALNCFSRNGDLLWRTEVDDPDLYWPYEITVDDSAVTVTFESGTARFGLDGSLLD